jgi:hypothetical protein
MHGDVEAVPRSVEIHGADLPPSAVVIVTGSAPYGGEDQFYCGYKTPGSPAWRSHAWAGKMELMVGILYRNGSALVLADEPMTTPRLDV